MSEQKRKPDYEMEEYFEGTEPEHFKAFADSTRHRIMSLLYERAATTKQLADALGMKSGSIAHHLKVLEGVGIVRVVRTRQVRAITEKYYGMRYRRMSLTGKNISWPEQMPEITPGFHLQQALDDYDRSAYTGDMKRHEFVDTTTYRHARIPASRAKEFASKVIELADDFDVEPVPGERVYGFVASVFLTSLPELPDERDEDTRQETGE